MVLLNVSTICSRRGNVARALLLVAFFLATPARPTTFAKMSLEQITGASPLVVRARCQGSIVVSEKAEIWTVTSFAVREVWKGSAPVVVRVRLLGGHTAQYTSHVEGVPRFRPGEDVVLFLRPMQRGDFTITSWAQGTFRIHRATSDSAPQVTQDTAAAAAEFAGNGNQEGPTRDAIRAVPLEEFRRRVTAASSRSTNLP